MWHTENCSTFLITWFLGPGIFCSPAGLGEIGHKVSEAEDAFNVRKEEEMGDWIVAKQNRQRTCKMADQALCEEDFSGC